mmetsp:Transcript_27105/g.31818  ORF Transcript_27105/g.31818 Transcript_27105/m.31818 type:complete len:109 (+) Transcript_27105:1160-1486(+)
MDQYLLAIGEYAVDDFSDRPLTWLCFILFILATFFIQVTMLNMLIAIMADTFSNVYQKKEVRATKTKLEFVSDKPTNLTAESQRQEQQVFLFVVTPAQAEEVPSDPIE